MLDVQPILMSLLAVNWTISPIIVSIKAGDKKMLVSLFHMIF